MIFNALLARGWLNRVGMVHLIKNPHWDFMKCAKIAFATSWTIIIIGMCYGIFVRGNKVLGIDFAGGDSVKMSFKEKVDVDKLRSALDKVGDTANSISERPGAEQEMLEVVAPFGKGGAVTNALHDHLPLRGISCRLAADVVGATVGVEIQKSAIIASFLSLFGILIYVALRYEFSFSVRGGSGGHSRRVDDHRHLFPFRPAIKRAHGRGRFDHHWFLHQRHHRHF